MRHEHKIESVYTLTNTSCLDQLKDYFECMGHPVEKITIMRDKETGKSRGFGFIFFQHYESVHKIPAICVIEGRKVC